MPGRASGAAGAPLSPVSAGNAGPPSYGERGQCGPHSSPPLSQGPGPPHTAGSAGRQTHTGQLQSVISIHCPPLHAPTLYLPSFPLHDFLPRSLAHTSPASPHSPLPTAAASPALQSYGPGNSECHSRRAQNRTGVGPRGYQADFSSASGGAGSSLAQGRRWGPGIPHSGRTQTGSAEKEVAAYQLRAMGYPWEPRLSHPTHVLGEEETTNFNFFFRNDPGVDGDHRVETAGKRRCRPASGSKEGQSTRPCDPLSLVPQAPLPISALPQPTTSTSHACVLPHTQTLCSRELQPTAGSPSAQL